MYSHAPSDYSCPLCRIAGSAASDANPRTTAEDVFFHDEFVTAFIAAKWWGNNAGHAIVIPNQHFENIFDLPVALGAEIHRVAREVAVALKAVYQCEGVSTRQHNEPAGNQDVWHYHLHVFPRYEGDGLYGSKHRWTTQEERRPYSAKLRVYFAAQSDGSAPGNR